MKRTGWIALLLWWPALVAAQAPLATLALDGPAEREGYRRIVNALERTIVSFEWDRVPLKDAVRDLARWTGSNILLAPAIKGREDEPVSLTLREVRARVVVDVLQESLKLAVQHRHGVLFVTTEEDALKQSMVLAIFDIHDLLYEPPDFPGPEGLGLRPGKPVPVEAPEEKKDSKDPAFLVDLIKTTTGAKLWEVEGASIVAEHGRLIVRHSPEVQRKVRSLVESLRAFL